MIPFLEQLWNDVSHFDILVFTLNLILFVFSKWIVALYPGGKEAKSYSRRLWSLRLINLLLFAMYFVFVFFTEHAQKISATGLVLLVGYIVNHIAQYFIMHRFGRERDLDGEKILSATYQSHVFGLLTLLLLASLTLVGVINIWGVTNLLQATGVVGAIFIIIYFTKEAWAEDTVNALIILYHRSFGPGSVIACKELDLLAIVVRTTLIQTMLRDLRTGHTILVPNTKLRNARIDVLTEHMSRGLDLFIDYKIGYDASEEAVTALFECVWKEACTKETSINENRPVSVNCLETGDHAVTWRVFFSVKVVYRMLKAKFAFNSIAFRISEERGIGLNTPFTHDAHLSRKPVASPIKTIHCNEEENMDTDQGSANISQDMEQSKVSNSHPKPASEP